MRTLLNRRKVMLEALDKSPYSKAATTTLKTDFPDYWEDIKAYGYANPQMVSWINEDPHLICSLLDVGKVRWLVGDGNAYIGTGYYPKQSTGIKIKGKQDNKDSALFGVALYFYCFDNYNNLPGILHKVWYGLGAVNGNFNYNLQSEIAVIQLDNTGVKINGVSYATISTSETFTSPYSMTLFCRKSAEGVIQKLGKHIIEYAELYESGTAIKKFYPFIHNSTNGMLDILTGTFYPNANSKGSFTIEEHSILMDKSFLLQKQVL